MLPAQLHLQRGLSLLWLSSYTSHVTLQAAEKVRVIYSVAFVLVYFLTSKHLVLCADTQCRKIPENLAGLRGVCFYLVKHFSSGNSRNHFRKGHMVTAIPLPLLLCLKTYLEQFLLCNQNIILIQAAAALWQWSHFHLLRVGMFTRGEIWTTLSGL